MSYVSQAWMQKTQIMASDGEIQDILNYTFTKRELPCEATLAAGAASQKKCRQ